MRQLLSTKPVGTLYNNCASNNIATGSWLQLLSSIPVAASAIEVFNPSGSILQLSIGAAGHETDTGKLFLYTIQPGGSTGLLPFEIPNSKPLSVKAVDAAVSDGYLVINFFG